ncbi:MAG TPA: heme ABC transporter ATP-binding protein [Armatimonadota bacterium]|jgi:iron complex transport system ATP-binding protein
MPPLYRVENLNVSLSSTHVLKGISFDVHEGEFLGIIGPNGSGKSTLLRAMSGVVPSTGSIMFCDKSISDYSGRDIACRLAVVPQESPVAFEYTVMEVVLMGRSPHLGRFQLESEADAEIAIEALDRTNLVSLADRKVSDLSGGERQRVMIARALAQDVPTIFLDEPTAHLDIKYQVEVLHLARRENVERGKTIVVVLHDLNLAAEFCDRLVMLKDGQLFASGTPEDVITAANVKRVYGASVWVRKHPTSGRPYVLSMGSEAFASKISLSGHTEPTLRVHVICGGGSGGPAFAALLEAGCEVTAGVINIGDSDQESAETLGIEYVEDAPFSPVSEKAEKANVAFIEEADAVLIADTPFGTGNVTNLRNAVEAAGSGKPVAIIGGADSFERRDFTGGEAERLLNRLVEEGAEVLGSAGEAAAWVAKTRCV